MTPELLDSLCAAIGLGETIPTLALGAPNVVVDIKPEGVYIETEKSHRAGTGPQLVPAWMIQVAFDELYRAGRLTAQHLQRDLSVMRSSAVCAVLARLPGVEVASSRPIVLRLCERQ